MADMYGTILSNEFKVKNVAAFKEWFKKYYFGEDITIFDHVEPDGSGTISYGSDEQYPYAYPRLPVGRELTAEELDAMGLDEEDLYPDHYVSDDIEDACLETFAEELRKHLMPKEIFYVIAGGNEKLRYVLFQELIIAEDIPDGVIWENHCSDDDPDFLRKRFYE